MAHSLSAMLRFRMLAIACGYEDADDCDALRAYPVFKPGLRKGAGMRLGALFPAPPAAIILDIDDTGDAVYGHQQLTLFHAHYDTHCSSCPSHVYHVECGKPEAVLLRPGKTPSGPEGRTLVKYVVRRIRRHWPHIRIVFRGDSHYGRAEAMAWCEENARSGSKPRTSVRRRGRTRPVHRRGNALERVFGNWGRSPPLAARASGARLIAARSAAKPVNSVPATV